MLLGLLVVLASGCAADGGGTAYLHPNADLSIIQRVAVLPLENLTSDRFAGERVREVLVVELLAEGLFDVLDTGEVNRVLRLRNVEDVSVLGPQAVADLGRELGVQAVMLGTVMEYRERRSGTFSAPEVAISLRLVDVESGLPVWSVSGARTGLGVWTRLFGVGEKSFTEAVRDLVRRLIPSLYLGEVP